QLAHRHVDGARRVPGVPLVLLPDVEQQRAGGLFGTGRGDVDLAALVHRAHRSRRCGRYTAAGLGRSLGARPERMPRNSHAYRITALTALLALSFALVTVYFREGDNGGLHGTQRWLGDAFAPASRGVQRVAPTCSQREA